MDPKIKLFQRILIANCLIILGLSISLIFCDNPELQPLTTVPSSSHHHGQCSNESRVDCHHSLSSSTSQEALIILSEGESAVNLGINSPFSAQQRDPIDPINGIPIAFGDFNSDHRVDVLLLTEGGRTIQALKGMDCVDGKTVLTYFGSRNCLSDWVSQFKCSFDRVVVNLVLSDFTGGNRLDLLVTLRNEDGSLDIGLVRGDSLYTEAFTCKKFDVLFKNIHTQPLVLDYDGDMISDFIITLPDCPTYLWNGGMSGDDAKHLHQPSSLPSNFLPSQSPLHQHAIPRQKSLCLNLSQEKNFAFAQPHSSAFVNLNAYQTDLSPDIYLNGKDKFEYVYNVAGKGFVGDELNNAVVHSYPNYNVRGQSAFMDMSYSGQMNHLIPVCLDSNARSFTDCGQIGVLAYDLEKKEWNNVLHPTPESGVNPTNRTLSFTEQNFFGNANLVAPVTLRIGDLNYDGYPDFAAILVDVDDASKRTFAAIYLNVQDPAFPNDAKKRLFKLSWMSEMMESEPVVMVTFFDLYNNGRLNLLMTTWSQVNQKYATKPYDYYMEKRLYYSFLRVMVISGRCSDKSTEDKCPPDERNEQTLAFGTNPHGPMACFAGPFSSLHTCGAQLSQSAHFALQLPFMVFGLGDVLNVVSNLQVSIPNGPKNPEDRVQLWLENTPGSNLVMVPYPLDDKSKWDIRAFINMSIYSMISLAFLIFLGLVLTVAIYVLHYREKKEDRKDHLEYKKHWL